MISPVGLSIQARTQEPRNVLQERVQPVRRYPANDSRPNAASPSHVNIARRHSPVHVGFNRITNTPTHDDIHGTNFGTVAQASETQDPASRMPTPIREGVIATQAALASGNPFFASRLLRRNDDCHHEKNTNPFALSL